jgi:hypothetical protein
MSLLDALSFPNHRYTPVVNPSSPRSGIHLYQHQIFNHSGLGVVLFVRNTFTPKGNIPSGVKVCLKLIATRKLGSQGYSQPNDKVNNIVFEISKNEIANLYAFIHNNREYYSFEVANGAIVDKKLELFKSLNEKGIIFGSFKDESKELKVSLDRETIFALSYVCLSVYKIHYPNVSDDFINNNIFNHSFSNDEAVTESVREVKDDVFGLNEADRITSKQSMAIYAIGINKWPSKNEDVIDVLREILSFKAADKMIKAANKGDFSLFDYALTEFEQGRFPARR